jgi:transposase
MAAARRGARHPGKSEPIDTEAVALAALRHQDLPVAVPDGPTREVKLLVDYRRAWCATLRFDTLPLPAPAGC